MRIVTLKETNLHKKIKFRKMKLPKNRIDPEKDTGDLKNDFVEYKKKEFKKDYGLLSQEVYPQKKMHVSNKKPTVSKSQVKSLFGKYEK